VTVTHIEAIAGGAAADVLCEAFHDYPVMRFVLGEGPDYDRRLRWLISLFVAARALRGEPILGIADGESGAVAAALVTLPGRESPPELIAKRQSFWNEIGSGAKARYDHYRSVAGSIGVPTPSHHLNMIGVRRASQGRGFARVLVEAIHQLAQADTASAGVSLNTEAAENVPLYEHLGYRVSGRARVTDGIETWAMFWSARG